ncbi:MAG: plasmid pRiA4b ORF-3 family protein [Oscillospiraceae bacterium]|jgi:hypothetical protein|nr:plasmid pRiA4b ORF-3 family protein [Oscillospiraceae bacterium]
MATQPIYQLTAELLDFKPVIWRSFQVAGNVKLSRLAYIIMTMFEMEASHMFNFEHVLKSLPNAKDAKPLIVRYELPDMDLDIDGESKDASKTKLSSVLSNPEDLLCFVYDFGDGWQILLTLEEVITDEALPAKELPRILAGEGLGIVEDAGGVEGLYDIVEAFKDKQGEAYEEYREWMGIDDFDISYFDIADLNKRLKRVPTIYTKIYEKHQYPTQSEINFLNRTYMRRWVYEQEQEPSDFDVDDEESPFHFESIAEIAEFLQESNLFFKERGIRGAELKEFKAAGIQEIARQCDFFEPIFTTRVNKAVQAAVSEDEFADYMAIKEGNIFIINKWAGKDYQKSPFYTELRESMGEVFDLVEENDPEGIKRMIANVVWLDSHFPSGDAILTDEFVELWDEIAKGRIEE